MKRGQVAMFVILGIVIISTIVVVYTFRSQLLEATFGKQTRETLVVPPQAEKIKIFLESCIRQVGEEAINTLAIQGGYTTLPAPDIPASPVYPFSNNFDVFNNKGVEVPFWFFEDARGSEITQVPTTTQMEERLADYMDTFLETCTNNFITFQQQDYSITPANPQTTVDITKDDILFTVDIPIVVALDDFTFQFNKVQVTVDSPLQELYSVAKEIMIFENKNYFIEDRTLDLMVVYDDIPFSGIDFECTPQSWTKTKVYNNFKTILAANMPGIKIDGTTYTKGNEAKSFVIEAVKGNHQLTANLRFDESWPLLMEVLGENGEILRGEPFTTENEISRFLLPLFCLNDYHFVYNLKFPVVITLEKDDLVFQFATMAIIQNNQPRENRENIEVFEVETPICDHPSKELTITVDGYGKNGAIIPLPGARVSLKCLRQVCELGNTQREGATATLTKEVPSCFNALLIAEAGGFHRAQETISTNKEMSEAGITLEPLQTLNVEVIIDDEGNDREMYSSEQILFTFENTEQQYTTSLIYPDQKEVQLVAGRYLITSTLIIASPNGFRLEEKEIEVCNDVPRKGLLGVAGLSEKQCIKQTIEATTLDQLLVGGSSLSWFVDREALLNAETIKLYTYRGPTPRSIDEVPKVQESIQKQEARAPVLQ